MSGASWLKVSVVASLALALTGCSHFMVDGPPKDYRSLESFEGTEHSQAPMVDALATVAGAVAVLTGLYSEGDDWLAVGFVAGSLVVPAAGISSILGFRRVNKCRDAKQELRERLGEVGRGRDSPWPTPFR